MRENSITCIYQNRYCCNTVIHRDVRSRIKLVPTYIRHNNNRRNNRKWKNEIKTVGGNLIAYIAITRNVRMPELSCNRNVCFIALMKSMSLNGAFLFSIENSELESQ